MSLIHQQNTHTINYMY